MSRYVAFIPARGGSSRIKDKNLQRVGGISLVRRAALCAQDSKLFDEVIVSTDSDEIASEVKDIALIDSRPNHLADGKATVLAALCNTIARHDLKRDVMGVLLPTCALRNADDLGAAQALFMQSPETAVVSVSEYETPVHLAFSINNDGRLNQIFPDSYQTSTRSVDHPRAYRFNGGIIFNQAHAFFSQDTLVGNNAIPYLMPYERSIDIDWFYQLEMVRTIADKS